MARESWSSGWGFILASIGSAVGIGNIWRFPYIVGVNGGGAFLIPYLIAVFLVGLPLFTVEFGIGHHYKASIIPALTALHQPYRWAGVFIVIIVSIIVSYYLVITGWILAFILIFLSNQPVTFGNFVGSWMPMIFYLIAVFLTFFIVRSGVRAGIETLSVYLIPLLYVMLIGLAAYVLTLPGAGQGISFYLTPDTSRLGDPFVWTAAFGQAFFSLSVGMGIMITYGSYSGEARILKNSSLVAFFDTLASLLAGFVIFPLVFTFGLSPAAGVQLAFVTLPSAFGAMDYGSIVGTVFFVLLFIAAITSAVSMVEVPISTLIDVYKVNRKRSALIIGIIIGLVGIPSALSYSAAGLEIAGLTFLEVLDLLFGTFGLIGAGLMMSLIVGWTAGIDVILREFVGNRSLLFFKFMFRYGIPIILGLTLVLRIVQETGLLIPLISFGSSIGC